MLIVMETPIAPKVKPGTMPCDGRMTKFFTLLVGQSCCSALKSWAARQHRPAKDAKIFTPLQLLCCSIRRNTLKFKISFLVYP